MCKNDVEKTSFGRVLHCGLRWIHHSLKLFQKFRQWNLSDVASDRIRSMKTAPFLQGFALINFFFPSFSSLSSWLLYFLSSSFSPYVYFHSYSLLSSTVIVPFFSHDFSHFNCFHLLSSSLLSFHLHQSFNLLSISPHTTALASYF